MARSLSLNNSQPGRWQLIWRVVRPMLLLSLGIHALALLVPLPPKAVDAEKAAEEQAITITQLPPVEQSTAKPAASTASATAPKPPLAAVPARPAVVSSSIASSSRPTVSSQPVITYSSPSASPSVASSPQMLAAAPSPTVVDAFPSDFPQYPEAQPGTFGLPSAYEPFGRKTSKEIGEVDEWLQQQLARQGYTVEPVEQSSQRMVYRVMKGGATQFLSLIPNAAGGTNILVIPDPLMQSGDQAILPTGDSKFLADLTSILPTSSTSGWQTVSNPTELLAEPGAFFENPTEASSQLKSDAENAAYIENQDVDAVFGSLQPKFQAAEIDVVLQGNYGGGFIYEALRGNDSHFFSLVPTKDSKSTLLVVWSKSPL